MSGNHNELKEVYEISVKSYIDSITASINDFLTQFIVNESDIKFLLEWGNVLPNVALTHSDLQADKIGDVIAESMSEEMVTTIEADLLAAITINQSAVLVQSTVGKVHSYVRKYDIITRGVDNYKVRYFMGLALLEYLEKYKENFTTHPRVLRGVANLMILNTMFNTLDIEENATVPDDMFKKFKICMLENKGRGLNMVFGDYGLYLLFKTLSKTLSQERTAMAHALLPNA